MSYLLKKTPAPRALQQLADEAAAADRANIVPDAPLGTMPHRERKVTKPALYPEFWGDVALVKAIARSAWQKKAANGPAMQAVKRLEAEIARQGGSP